MNKTTRWKQRFDNLKKSFTFLKKSIDKKNYNELEMSGLIKAFELTFELSWKTLKDYLEAQGIEEKFPRSVIKSAFSAQIITDGHIWIEMLDKRNEFSHTYDEESVKKIVKMIKTKYFSSIEQLYDYLQSKYQEEINE
ncbi:MAG: hypothetical protein A2381_17240 [Bdellovibrionales bacterium RIFOXYB1_FULL_37_110]|nr:MAG: hypothetical protein A2181_08245 [Bdellovibrionales bacterium RIFOXYA1_FULL_38_20]OFZ50140.1 MAG: hypothetical protein A2417_19075 [Bdellovibrionales bacterium RIFOXYC1_FULL_37_79]OFZ60046.1 MAG: hypothetical protein A2381_17240 [Bdellovibrionales bacterium RIFOXYB1_FULL_37_110]OFZ62670.1 MAG: hypothetical protein A2577_16235 [Bdellovibrionales bacterium RIFOXYD1_FULL_36_51]